MFNYIDYYNDLIKSDSIYWFCALSGSGMFLIQFIINIFGFTDQDNFDVVDATDASSDFSDAKKFKWVSMQAITGFLMMFGWTAITCQSEFGLPNTPTDWNIHCCRHCLQPLSFALFLSLQKNFRVLEVFIELKMQLGKRRMFINPSQKTGLAKFQFHCNILRMKLMPSLTILKNCLHLCV